MSETVKIMAMLLLVGCAVNYQSTAQAQGLQEEQEAPTIVYGESETAPGVSEEVVVEQPDNNVNPLGNPIPEIVAPAQPIDMTAPQPVSAPAQPQPQMPADANAPTPQDAKDLNPQFQNTLMEADGEVYDVQAYPEADLKAIGNPSNPETLYSPNVNPY